MLWLFPKVPWQAAHDAASVRMWILSKALKELTSVAGEVEIDNKTNVAKPNAAKQSDQLDKAGFLRAWCFNPNLNIAIKHHSNHKFLICIRG